MKKAAGGRSHRCSVVAFLVLLVGTALVAAPVALAQEARHETEGEHAAHAEELTYRHVVSFFGGLSTHTERADTDVALGVSYAYKLTHKWAVGVKGEYAFSRLERDLVVLAAVAFEPVERVEFAVGVGTERVSKDEIEDGVEHTVEESEALLRLTFAYGFRLRPGLSISPEFNADIGGSRVTYVYGLVLSVGL